MKAVKDLEKTQDEILIEERIKSGEEIEVTEALEILSMIKNNIPLEEISSKTNKPISKLEELKSIFKL